MWYLYNNLCLPLIERDLGGLLVGVNVLVERAIGIVGLLLDGGAELEKLLGNGLLGGSEDVDEAVGQIWLA